MVKRGLFDQVLNREVCLDSNGLGPKVDQLNPPKGASVTVDVIQTQTTLDRLALLQQRDNRHLAREFLNEFRSDFAAQLLSRLLSLSFALRFAPWLKDYAQLTNTCRNLQVEPQQFVVMVRSYIESSAWQECNVAFVSVLSFADQFLNKHQLNLSEASDTAEHTPGSSTSPR